MFDASRMTVNYQATLAAVAKVPVVNIPVTSNNLSIRERIEQERKMREIAFQVQQNMYSAED